MSSLGFRPPQFSEDVAWLPAWLLPHPQLDSSSLQNQPQILSNQPFKGLMSPCGNILSTEAEEQEGGYNNRTYRLLLSGGEGDSHPSISDAPSPHNVLHLCLRLSSDTDSQSSKGPQFCSSGSLNVSRKEPLEQADISAVREEPTCQLKLDHNDGGVNVSPLTSTPVAVVNIVPQSLTDHEDTGKKHEENMDHNAEMIHSPQLSSVPATVATVGPPSLENHKSSGQEDDGKYNPRHINDDDLNDAVELSIGASEALVIHELMKTESSSEMLPMRAILEAALHVKQARLQDLGDAFDWSSDEIHEIVPLSDLDELSMMDAFEDVGLSSIGLNAKHASSSDVSHVEDTPVLKNPCGDNGCKGKGLLGRPPKILDNLVTGLKNSDDACLGQTLCQPSDNISSVPTVAEDQADANLSNACSKNSEDKSSYLVADRYQSRWLGGWGVEEVDASAKSQQNCTKGVGNFFVETSSLSESADVAPDENSFVQKHETLSKMMVSQPSIQAEGCHDRPIEALPVSQEVRSSNMSLLDPLCSVVPCSISLENAGFSSSQNQGNQEVDAENFLGPESEHAKGISQYISDVNVESVDADTQDAMPTISGECSGALVRRQLAEFRNYSTVRPKNGTIFEERRPYCNQQLSSEHFRDLLPSYQDLGFIRSSDQRDPEPLRSVFERTGGRENEKNMDTNVARNLVVKTSKKRKSLDQPEKEVSELHIRSPVHRKSPLILNRRTRCRLQASELVDNFTRGTRRGEAVAQGTKSKLGKNLQNIESKLQKPCSQNLVRKRVCFSTVVAKLQHNKDLKHQTAHENFSNMIANKNTKYSNPWLDYLTADGKDCFGGHSKDTRRLIFYGLEFLLTGFSRKKEKDIVGLLQQHGGIVLLDIPPPPSNPSAKRYSKGSNFQHLPIIISSKKLQTTKFLYGCAVNGLILKLKWVTDSIAAGSTAPAEKYMILPYHTYLVSTRTEKSVCNGNLKRIFDGVGIVLHGRQSFCAKLAIIIKHGGGQVFKTLLRLFQCLDDEKISTGAIVAEDESRALRHLRHCASERKLPMMRASWVVKSLHSGKLSPFAEKEGNPLTIKVPELATSMDWSQEI